MPETREALISLAVFGLVLPWLIGGFVVMELLELREQCARAGVEIVAAVERP
jgi:hypothetical protein